MKKLVRECTCSEIEKIKSKYENMVEDNNKLFSLFKSQKKEIEMTKAELNCLKQKPQEVKDCLEKERETYSISLPKAEVYWESETNNLKEKNVQLQEELKRSKNFITHLNSI